MSFWANRVVHKNVINIGLASPSKKENASPSKRSTGEGVAHPRERI